MAECRQPKLEMVELAKNHDQALEENTSSKGITGSKLVQKAKAEAALEWLEDEKDRKLLIHYFGLGDQVIYNLQTLSVLQCSTPRRLSARLQELLDRDHYIQESSYLIQRRQSWQAYPHLSLTEREFAQELFNFYNPQGMMDSTYFTRAKISWESLKQRIREINNEQALLEQPSRCSLEEHDYLFRRMADPSLCQPSKDAISRLWPRMGNLERRITLLSFGLAGCQIHSPEEITRLLLQDQPLGLNKVRGLLNRITTENLNFSLRKK